MRPVILLVLVVYRAIPNEFFLIEYSTRYDKNKREFGIKRFEAFFEIFVDFWVVFSNQEFSIHTVIYIDSVDCCLKINVSYAK